MAPPKRLYVTFLKYIILFRMLSSNCGCLGSLNLKILVLQDVIRVASSIFQCPSKLFIGAAFLKVSTKNTHKVYSSPIWSSYSAVTGWLETHDSAGKLLAPVFKLWTDSGKGGMFSGERNAMSEVQEKPLSLSLSLPKSRSLDPL